MYSALSSFCDKSLHKGLAYKRKGLFAAVGEEKLQSANPLVNRPRLLFSRSKGKKKGPAFHFFSADLRLLLLLLFLLLLLLHGFVPRFFPLPLLPPPTPSNFAFSVARSSRITVSAKLTFLDNVCQCSRSILLQQIGFTATEYVTSVFIFIFSPRSV